jgi:hypothetical protein
LGALWTLLEEEEEKEKSIQGRALKRRLRMVQMEDRDRRRFFLLSSLSRNMMWGSSPYLSSDSHHPNPTFNGEDRQGFLLSSEKERVRIMEIKGR